MKTKNLIDKDMKIINICMLGAALLSGLTSCEMKEEIFGKDIPQETGFLTLDISAGSTAEVETKAEDLAKGVNKDEFPLVISAVDFEYKQEYESFSEFKEETDGTIELPIGKYEIEVHSPGEFADEMDVPYFGGTEDVEITTGITKPTTVVCSIQNTQIAMVFSPDFIEFYSEWTITVTDGKSHTKIYTKADVDASPVFWKMSPETDKIYVNGTAKIASNGETVAISEVLTKKDSEDYEEGDSPYFGGGDGLAISLAPQKEGGINKGGIIITVKGFDQESEEEIPIDVTPGGDDNTPSEPGDGDGEDGGGEETPGGDPTITIPQNTYTLPDEADKNADVKITASEGATLTSVKVTINGDGQFGTIIGNLFNGQFLEGLELVGNKELSTVLGQVGVTVPSLEEGQSDYTFPVGSFFTLLNAFKTDSEDGHVFKIYVEDSKGGKDSSTLNIIVK